MKLSAGHRLGAYEIVALIGAGGMGEVYRARDTKLQRDVAIKVLPALFANDPERLARFEREARTLAALNHPHIAQVYGVEGTALVMEFVDGEDLSQRIARAGAIPLEDALPIAIQIAQALEAAHDQGIVHRDLKPANIKQRHDGSVKVLDFGLAKALDQGSSSNLLNSPTMTSPANMTVRGVVLGTAAYMSPEQARGKAVDRRADIWAFGVVLYEMLTGGQAFAAETVSDTIAAVLTREPALDALPPGTPAGVRRVLERCLDKDPARRYHHIADARIDLEHPYAGPSLAAGPASAASRSRRWIPGTAIGLVSAAVAASLVWVAMSQPAAPSRRHSFTVPGAGFSGISHSAISPDGKWLAYAPTSYGAPFRLFLRSLETFEEREIVAAQSTSLNPFFSPDSEWLAFFMDNALYKVPISGGTPQRIAPVLPGASAGSWADNGTILASMNIGFGNAIKTAVSRLSVQKGAFEPMTNPGASESHLDPEVLPGSRTVLFGVVTTQSSAIAAVPFTGGTPRILISDARTPRYSGTGHLVYQRASTGDLLAVRFDPSRVETSGEPVRIASAAVVVDSGALDVARDGTVVYSGAADTAEQTGLAVAYVDRSGVETPLLAELGSWAEPRMSPDGRTLLVREIQTPNCHLWTIDLARGTRTRATLEGDNHAPSWRRNGELTWGGETVGVRGIRMAWADRPAQVTELAASANSRMPGSWSPDGKRLALTETHPSTGADIWLFSIESNTARPFIATAFKEAEPQFSPDGTWMAYVSNDSGRDEIYVQPADGDGGRQQISSSGGHSPVWSPRGGELFFVEQSQLMAVEIDLGRTPSHISRPRKLLTGPYVWERVGNYSITPDGRRFIVIRRGQGPARSATLRVLLGALK